MTVSELAKLRMESQHVAGKRFESVADLVSWMAALQAQDFPMVRWAVGIRLPAVTVAAVEAAIDRAEVLRTHVLRPTWHLVAAGDLSWMLSLTAPRIKASLNSRHKQLEIDEELVRRSHNLITDAIAKRGHLLREELVAELQAAGIETADNRASHLLLMAELDGLICSGASRNGRHTYALLEERIRERKRSSVTTEEACARLAQRYFCSRGPATLEDFVWWSGLQKREARRGLDAVKSELREIRIGEQSYWGAPPDNVSIGDRAPAEQTGVLDGSDEPKLHLLPAFDELIVAYADRSAAIRKADYKSAVSQNGIFHPVIVADGAVIGTWKRRMQNKSVAIETRFFDTPPKDALQRLQRAADAFGHFLGKQVEVTSNAE